MSTKPEDKRKADIEKILNNAEIIHIAELFLSVFPFKRENMGYGFFRDAVIALSCGYYKPQKTLELLAEISGIDDRQYRRHVSKAVNSLEKPICELFNEHYGNGGEPDDGTLPLVMRNGSLNYTLAFFGTVLRYIMFMFFPKFEYPR